MPDPPVTKKPQLADIGLVVGEKITATTIKSVEAAINANEALVDHQSSKIASLVSENLSLMTEKKTLTDKLKLAESQADALRTKNAKLETQRPSISPESLGGSFAKALDSMQQAVKTGEPGAQFQVTGFHVALRTNITSDEKGKILLQLPSLDETLSAQNLSEVKFSLVSAPAMFPPPAKTVEIPNVVGQDKASAAKYIKDVKLKLGEITEVESPTQPGIIIRQNPEAYSYAPAGAPVDLTVAKSITVAVPDLTGKDKDEAVRIIEELGLRVGEVREKQSAASAGTVVDQRPKPKTLVSMGIIVDLTVAVPQK